MNARPRGGGECSKRPRREHGTDEEGLEKAGSPEAQRRQPATITGSTVPEFVSQPRSRSEGKHPQDQFKFLLNEPSEWGREVRAGQLASQVPSTWEEVGSKHILKELRSGG